MFGRDYLQPYEPDLTPERNAREADAAVADVEYVQGDMRAPPWRHRFDAALLWYPTFGYFDEADKERVGPPSCPAALSDRHAP